MIVSLKKISKEYTTVLGKKWALKDVDLTIKKNQRIGIIGPNGSGKSTLLKVIAGITQPTKGIIKKSGKIVSLADLEAGFHPDLTGRENIMVNGLLIGVNRNDIIAKINQVIDFADIGNYIDAPFFTYSQGMKFRLAFAVATISKCDLLVLDEVFVAGDVEYQFKVMQLIKKMQKATGMATIISSHILAYAMSLADIFYYLSDGKIIKMSRSAVNSLLKNESSSWEKEFGVYFGYLNRKKIVKNVV